MNTNHISHKLKSYAMVELSPDLSMLTDQQIKIVSELIAASKYADTIFWQQSAHDALSIRREYATHNNALKKYIEINYGAYDRLDNQKRFVGTGPEKKPLGAGFYPEDLSRKEFLDYIDRHPLQKDDLQNLYTVVERDGKSLKATFYHQYYAKDVQPMIDHLQRAANLCDNQSLKRYLSVRAEALANDEYYQSDLAWMDLKDHQIDLVIGPIENYEDTLFNYKAAYEAAVLIRDDAASRELEIYKQHLANLEKHLPVNDKYKKESVGLGNILEIVNVANFGGDFNAGVKTIAASLPNDERVIAEKGAKKQLYKNIMEAKFDYILQPIAISILDKPLHNNLSKKEFISQILLHEIAHTVGPIHVFGKTENVRHALRDRYAIIEECKADVVGFYSTYYFEKVFNLSKEDLLCRYVTYMAGLFRSIRFGIEEAHGMANLIQLNFLRQHHIIVKDKYSGKYILTSKNFKPAIEELARELVMIEATGNYDKADELIERYGKLDTLIAEDLDRLNNIPRDLDITFNLNLE